MSEFAGLAPNTIYYWYSKRVDSPRVSYLSKVAMLIGAKLDDIWIAEADHDRD
ncbi:hypothetical protein [Lacticaseibacillus pabuli]|uniref:hypothetical protein n=1 Tax=Lacticaseibacillus pabuli TaxID=3025672 RepID=UPI003010463A